MNLTVSAKKIKINGVVQGVGFRPFLFVLAKKHHLNGEVSNTDDGVHIFVEGQLDNIHRFIHDIHSEKPLLSAITNIQVKDAQPQNCSLFKIVKSQGSQNRSTLISPDVAVCKDCLSELNDPNDRRHEYPFINCTHCGPRYTIIKDIPYDRPKTSMNPFTMCAACQKEYDNPLNRRFHAQPNACPDCGPQVFLTDNRGQIVESDPKTALNTAADLLRQGNIIAIKGLGGFHLSCDAKNSGAVIRLRKQKNRPHKPFALMAATVSAVLNHVDVNDYEKTLLESYHSPIVLLKKKSGPKTTHTDPDQSTAPDSVPDFVPDLACEIAPLNNYLGVMLPSTPLHHLLLQKGPDILVMTSGNRSGEPLSIENNDAVDAFSHIADYFLLHNRDIYFGADDSVIQVLDKKPRFIRRSRGYAPLPIYLNRTMPGILGCGGGLKSTVCLTRNNHAFLSPYIGDLDNKKVFEYYQNNIAHLKQILDIQPGIIAHDLHPGYMSSQYAMAQKDVKIIQVQHHHAHAAACMAENHLDEPVIAITLDGTGLGTDGHIWGGEILVCTQSGFTRKAHLSYVQMPGGDAAVLEPWRMATSLLYQAFGDDLLNLDLPFIHEMDEKKLSFICQMMEKDLNSPLTSSAGRLFDAVASLLCIRHTISYESQAAMELEAIAGDTTSGQAYDFHVLEDNTIDHENIEQPPKTHALESLSENTYTIDMIPAIGQIVESIGQGRSPSQISADFHHTMVTAFSDVAAMISQKTAIKKIVLSGGVFNNASIFTNMVNTLTNKGLMVFTHSTIPTGDGGISLGQAVIAAALEDN